MWKCFFFPKLAVMWKCFFFPNQSFFKVFHHSNSYPKSMAWRTIHSPLNPGLLLTPDLITWPLSPLAREKILPSEWYHSPSALLVSMKLEICPN